MAELKEDMLVPKVKVKEVSKEYEVPKEDLVPKTGDDAPTRYNKTAAFFGLYVGKPGANLPNGKK